MLSDNRFLGQRITANRDKCLLTLIGYLTGVTLKLSLSPEFHRGLMTQLVFLLSQVSQIIKSNDQMVAQQ